MRGDASRPTQLAFIIGNEADGERAYTISVTCHESRHEARIDAAGKECSKGHVADHSQLDGLLQQRKKFPCGARGGTRLIPIGDVPVLTYLSPTSVRGKNMTGRELADTFEQAASSVAVTIFKIAAQTGRVEFGDPVAGRRMLLISEANSNVSAVAA